MKTKIRTEDSKCREYPWVGKLNAPYGTNLVVLFSAPKQGTIIIAENSEGNTVGRFSTNWAEKDFRAVEVTLSSLGE